MEFVSMVIMRNAPLYDGTPRRERGFRPIVETIGPDANIFGRAKKRVWNGPLFASEDQAKKWRPEYAAIDAALGI